MSIPYLSEADLEGLRLSTAQIVEAIKGVIRGSDEGRVWAAPKAALMPPGDNRYMMAALAAMDGPSLLAVKTVVLNPDNPAKGLPQINGLVTMLDSVTGLPVAILDGNWVTAVRTAGLSATAATYMARKDAKVIGFVGCGVQARSHLQAFSDLFPLKRIKMFGRGQPNMDRLAEMARGLGLEVESCGSGAEVAASADLLITTVTHTGGAEPFLDANVMPEGSFAAVVDLAAPWIRPSFGALDRVAVDDLAQEAALPNKLCDPDHISGDLSGLVLGKLPGRQSDTERSAFVFRGHALGDLALAALAWDTYHNG
jgi:ornithine cyclodeaminase/alanine dehydrogenase